MATRTAQKRLTKEYKLIQESSPQYIEAHPNDNNILEWFYVITGPPETPYAGGEYMGTLVFPADYPFQPPAIRMCTPSGRFKPNTRLCLSMSDYHPNTWNPAWSVSTILVGLLSFMVSEEETTGSIQRSADERKRLAVQSLNWNRLNPKFQEQFPHLMAGPRPAEEAARGDTAAFKELNLTPLPVAVPTNATEAIQNLPAAANVPDHTLDNSRGYPVFILATLLVAVGRLWMASR